jgi:inward rectifier potassium channel
MASPPRRPRAQPNVRVLGGSGTIVGDGFHAFLRASWPAAIARLVVAYLALNALFGLAFWRVGGIANARPGSFRDAFYFSVHTLGTIGYGSMYPTSEAANVLVIVESVTGLLVTAVFTGLVFAKFGRTAARVMFIDRAVIHPHDGVPTLMIRVGNERSNRIIDACFRVVMTRTERTREGVLFYRMYDLPLVRERTTALTRSYTVMHAIAPGSPLYGYDPARMKSDEVEIDVTVTGLDDTTLQPVHSSQNYVDDEIVWGARPVDILTFAQDGSLTLDLHHFHDLVPTEPTEEFPYPQREKSGEALVTPSA